MNINRLAVTLILLATSLKGAPILAGVSFFSASTSGGNTGHYWGYQNFQVWIQENGNWITTAGGLQNLVLSQGTHTFTYFVSGNGLVFSQIGMNLQFGSTCRSGISVLATSTPTTFSANSSPSTFWPQTPSTLGACSGTNAAGSHSLTWADGVDKVTLTNFTYVEHQSSGVNLISYSGPPADTIPDHTGTFNLFVESTSSVPEPSTALQVVVGTLALVGYLGRTARRRT